MQFEIKGTKRKRSHDTRLKTLIGIETIECVLCVPFLYRLDFTCYECYYLTRSEPPCTPFSIHESTSEGNRRPLEVLDAGI